ncbi:MAG TPA: cation-transporting P-type ATPase [Polyangia bacterium]|nr:cation-transporting P-type ATPase [Polyangia bacterium]
MRIHDLDVDAVLASLGSSREGLSSAEAERRLREFGPNEVPRVQPEPLGRRLVRSFAHFFAFILWIAALLAFFAEYRDPGQGMGILGGAILGVILINGLFSFWQEHKAERAILELLELLPHQVKVLRDGHLVSLGTARLVPGDVVVFEEGDDVPADGRVIEAAGLRVNNATITGESLPLARSTAPSAAKDLLHADNVLLAGTSIMAGHGRAVVYATGAHTEFGRIAHLTQTNVQLLSPLQREIVRLSRILAGLATGLGVIFFVAGQQLGLPFWDNFIFAIGIIVANVPEGLLPTVTLALAMASQRMARRHVLVRHLPAVETLGSATIICTDKTGTLTENRMTARRLYVDRGFFPVEDEALVTLGATHEPLFTCAFLCQSLREVERGGRLEVVGDPMEIALVEMARRARAGTYEAQRELELPFEPERKRVSTLHHLPAGRVLLTKGAPETVLALCRRLHQEGGVVALDPALTERFRTAAETMAQDGLRVLCLAYRPLPEAMAIECLEEDLVLVGLVGLYDPPRPEVPGAIARCRQAGLKVIMVTGDHPRTAVAIGREIGLLRSPDAVVFTGEELHRLSDTQLQLALDAPEIVFARTAPEQKLRIVTVLQRKGEIVAVTGDGVNDAPALQAADIGVAMGASGTDVAREVADIVLTDDNFASIANAVEEGRAVFANIRKFMTYILTSNVPELVPYLAFVLFSVPLPLTILQILAVDLGTDMLPALALGAEEPDPRVMQQPPRSSKERLLDGGLLVRAYLFLGLLEAAAALATYFFVLWRGGWRYGVPLAATHPLYRSATAACLTAIIVTQVVNAFLCRSERESVFSLRAPGRLLLSGLAVEIVLILIIDYTPVGHIVFATAPVPASAWLFALPFAALMLGAEEVRKLIVRRRGRSRPSVS